MFRRLHGTGNNDGPHLPHLSMRYDVRIQYIYTCIVYIHCIYIKAHIHTSASFLFVFLSLTLLLLTTYIRYVHAKVPYEWPTHFKGRIPCDNTYIWTNLYGTIFMLSHAVTKGLIFIFFFVFFCAATAAAQLGLSFCDIFFLFFIFLILSIT